MLWLGEKRIAGDTPTEEELDMFIQAREISIGMAKKWMRLREEDWAYTPGEPFK